MLVLQSVRANECDDVNFRSFQTTEMQRSRRQSHAWVETLETCRIPRIKFGHEETSCETGSLNEFYPWNRSRLKRPRHLCKRTAANDVWTTPPPDISTTIAFIYLASHLTTAWNFDFIYNMQRLSCSAGLPSSVLAFGNFFVCSFLSWLFSFFFYHAGIMTVRVFTVRKR